MMTIQTMDLPSQILMNKSGENVKPVNEALSNYLILQNIFSSLNANDLETSCYVNGIWRTVAQRHLIEYDMSLVKVHVKQDSSTNYFEKEDHVVLSRHPIGQESQVGQERRKLTIKSAFQILVEASKSEKFIINLKIQDYGQIHTNNFKNLLSKFGSFVSSCTPQGSQMTVSDLCKSLLRDFPNLKKLNTSKYFFYPGYDHFNTHHPEQSCSSDPENQLHFLRKIDVGGFELKNYESLAKLLMIGPNLEEIHNFPILLTESLVVTQTGALVKTLQYHVGERQELNEETFLAALTKLAKLRPQLNSFSFCPPYKMPQDFLYGPLTAAPVLKILHSSHASLKSLTVLQSESVTFHQIPPMVSLKEINFLFNEILGEAQIFSQDISLTEQFPNVEAVKILMNLEGKFVRNYFPPYIFYPWGSQIKRLELRTLDSSSVEELSKIFSDLQYLKFHIQELPDNLHEIFPAISKYWPHLESLVIQVGNYPREICGSHKFEYRTLDAAFTGIPEYIVMELKDPLTMGKFTEEEFRKFREASALRRFQKLQLLKLDVSQALIEAKAFSRLSTLTSLSYEFGFKFLPELRFVLQTRPNQKIPVVEEIKTLLQPLMKFEVEMGHY